MKMRMNLDLNTYNPRGCSYLTEGVATVAKSPVIVKEICRDEYNRVPGLWRRIGEKGNQKDKQEEETNI